MSDPQVDAPIEAPVVEVVETSPGPEEPLVEAVPAQNIVSLTHEQSIQTTRVLANAVALVQGVAAKILGGEVATTFAGASLNNEMISQLAQSVFQKRIAQQAGE